MTIIPPLVGTIPVTRSGHDTPRPLHLIGQGHPVTITGTITQRRTAAGGALLLLITDGDASGMLLLPGHVERVDPAEGEHIRAHGTTAIRAGSVVVTAFQARCAPAGGGA